MKSICVSQHRVFESALADVVVAGCARKGEVISEQAIHWAPVFLLPRLVPLPNDLFVGHTRPSQYRRACYPLETYPSSERAGPRYKQIPARHCSPFHSSFSFSALVVVAFFGPRPVS